jgi:conjugal transfer/entry exclusion protein
MLTEMTVAWEEVVRSVRPKTLFEGGSDLASPTVQTLTQTLASADPAQTLAAARQLANQLAAERVQWHCQLAEMLSQREELEARAAAGEAAAAAAAVEAQV